MTVPVPPPDDDVVRRRQKSRSLVVALLLGAFALLMFLITLAKIRAGMQP